MYYERLFQPIQIGSLRLPNRVMMGAMHTNFEEHPNALALLTEFYQARTSVGLIVTGGISPSDNGRLYTGAQALLSDADLALHKGLTNAVHQADGRIALQILHAGRYAKISQPVSVTNEPSRINPVAPVELSHDGILDIIKDHARCAKLAEAAGYDAIEIMGSEGYLLSTFISPLLNSRADQWGGQLANRARLPIEVVKAIKAACNLPIIYRISAADLMPKANSVEEVQQLIAWLEEAGIDAVNLGIGWHESPVPTIATSVPRAGFASLAAQLTSKVPMILSNRIAMPDDADRVLATTNADMVSLARPLLADPNWLIKAKHDPLAINTCIACNQACLDRAFVGKPVGCMVNPNLNHTPLPNQAAKKVAVIGGGVAGLSCAVTAAKMGHQVTLYEQCDHLGGQLRLAAMVPGKEDYHELLRYFQHNLAKYNVTIKLNATLENPSLFDKVVWATGVQPKWPAEAEPEVLNYQQAFAKPREQLGQRVIVIGGGPIAVDFCQYLYGPHKYKQHWGIQGTEVMLAKPSPSEINVTLLQRGTESPHKKLGKTTGWAHWASLKKQGLDHRQGCEFILIEPNKVVFKQGDHKTTLTADTIVCCIGQNSNQAPTGSITIGGCRNAQAIDAERAIREGYECALTLL
ncbi:FAD-dependent oxidoreductase [Salinibius halmophilus]|uniref:FAD-dependent oxidoreductase n=1 Tax=Salinibius halmophilus TaxID=1853216 RepID=UPI000E670173|nr:FAD-dependent oxidoreductase [Salinibius halmophilus]